MLHHGMNKWGDGKKKGPGRTTQPGFFSEKCRREPLGQ